MSQLCSTAPKLQHEIISIGRPQKNNATIQE